MAINVLRGLRERTARSVARPAEPAALIGAYDDYDHPTDAAPRGPQVACPTCGTQLSLFQTKCSNCELRVLAGVPIKRGGLLMIAGCAGGILVGTVLAVGLALVQQPTHATGAGPQASAAVGAPGAAVPDPALVSGPVPPAAAAALRLTASAEDRLAASAASLRSQLKAKSFSATTAATTIRAIAADAAWGSDVVEQLADWPAAAPLRAQLSASYSALRSTARDALTVSLQSNAKYKAYAKQMVKLLASVGATRKAIEALGAANNITIPAPIPGD